MWKVRALLIISVVVTLLWIGYFYCIYQTKTPVQGVEQEFVEAPAPSEETDAPEESNFEKKIEDSFEQNWYKLKEKLWAEYMAAGKNPGELIFQISADKVAKEFDIDREDVLEIIDKQQYVK